MDLRKKEILNKILKDNYFESLIKFSDDILNYESHGNVLKLVHLLADSGIKDLKDYLLVISFLLDEPKFLDLDNLIVSLPYSYL